MSRHEQPGKMLAGFCRLQEEKKREKEKELGKMMEDVISLKRLKSGDPRVTEDKGESARRTFRRLSPRKKTYRINNTFSQESIE